MSVFGSHIHYVLQTNLAKLRTFQLELNEFADWSVDEFNAWKKGLIPSTSVRRDFSDDDESDDQSYRRSLRKLLEHRYYERRLKRSLYRRRLHNRRFFTDWFRNLFNGKKNTVVSNDGNSSNVFDWRAKGLVSRVKDQLKCGACYAFATVAVLETLYATKTQASTITEFSPQQFVDCSANGNNGCSGGNFPPSIRYLNGQGGKIATESSYPYKASKKTCQIDSASTVELGNIEFTGIAQGDENQLQEAVTNYGPVFIGLDTETKLFMFYKSGVLNVPDCPNRRQDMDHAMAIVGYGYDDALETPYWIIRNSWGAKWGENGYVRLAKNAGNMCGVASMAYYGKLT